MSNQKLNELKRKLYQLQEKLLELNKWVSKTKSDLAKANKIENEIDNVSYQINELGK